MPHALTFSLPPASLRHKEASAEERARDEENTFDGPYTWQKPGGGIPYNGLNGKSGTFFSSEGKGFHDLNYVKDTEICLLVCKGA